MKIPESDSPPALDLRHLGRIYDKDMPVENPGMEMSKPGNPDMRRRKYTVPMPNQAATAGPDHPPQTSR